MASPSDVTKVPPQNIEAEQSVLGGILLENESLYKALELLIEHDFYKPSHQKSRCQSKTFWVCHQSRYSKNTFSTWLSP